MSFYRLVKIQHARYVQEADVEAESPEAAVLLWNDHGSIEAIAMADLPAGFWDNPTEEEKREWREFHEREALRQEARRKEPRFS